MFVDGDDDLVVVVVVVVIVIVLLLDYFARNEEYVSVELCS